MVSDSGFDQGAIERAKEHGRIQLCQLVDPTTGWLRTTLSVPVCVSFVDLQAPYRFIFRRTLISSSPESPASPYILLKEVKEYRQFLSEFITLHGERVFSDFHHWSENHVGTISDGTHQHEVSATMPDGSIISTHFEFEQKTDSYITYDLLVDALGLYDVISKRISLGNEGAFTLDEAPIRKSWAIAPEDITRNEVLLYRRLRSYSPADAGNMVKTIAAVLA